MSDRPDAPRRDEEANENEGFPEPGANDAAAEAEARAVRALLKRSLGRDTDNAPDLLAGVQRRIRTRSRGKFFADGWSTTQARANYALIGVATLLLAVLAYYVLGPMGMR